MKKLSLLLLFVLVTLFACKDDDDDAELIPVNNDISGLWEFTLSPDEIFLDTSVHHGNSPADYDFYSSINEEVYLYQDEIGNVIGFSGTFKFSGKLTGKMLDLDVYVNPDGLLVQERPIDEMIKMSEMILTINDFGMMEGSGSYLEDQYFIDLKDDKYEVTARKLNGFDKSMPVSYQYQNDLITKGIKDDICKIIFTVSSWIISDLTDGIVRTMSSDCWLHKDGGGYYAFGHEGPGSLFPILTQSMYYPLEWSLCKVRDYGFKISLGGENISYTALKNSIQGTLVKEIFKKLGFSDFAELELAMDAFYQEYGGFGITIFYDTHTNHTGLYVNHEKGTGAENSALIHAMKGAFGSHYVYAGKDISDKWSLRRSDFLVCNTPIVICYVIGTNHVSYN